MRRPRYVKLNQGDIDLLKFALERQIETSFGSEVIHRYMLNLREVLDRAMNGRLRLYDPS